MRVSMNAEDEGYSLFEGAMRSGQTVIVKLNGVDVTADVITADESPKQDDPDNETRGFVLLKEQGEAIKEVRGEVKIEFHEFLPW